MQDYKSKLFKLRGESENKFKCFFTFHSHPSKRVIFLLMKSSQGKRHYKWLPIIVLRFTTIFQLLLKNRIQNPNFPNVFSAINWSTLQATSQGFIIIKHLIKVTESYTQHNRYIYKHQKMPVYETFHTFFL